MEPSQTPGATPAIVDSMDLVEFDVDTESFRATYDSTCESTYLAVVALVSTALGREPHDLKPLQYVIDTDELDELVPESSTGIGSGEGISFRYEGFEITLTSEEVVAANPIENA